MNPKAELEWYQRVPVLRNVDPSTSNGDLQVRVNPWPGFFLHGYVTHIYTRYDAERNPLPDQWIAHFSETIYNGQKEEPSRTIWKTDCKTRLQAVALLEQAMQAHLATTSTIERAHENLKNQTPRRKWLRDYGSME